MNNDYYIISEDQAKRQHKDKLDGETSSSIDDGQGCGSDCESSTSGSDDEVDEPVVEVSTLFPIFYLFPQLANGFLKFVIS